MRFSLDLSHAYRGNAHVPHTVLNHNAVVNAKYTYGRVNTIFFS